MSTELTILLIIYGCFITVMWWVSFICYFTDYPFLIFTVREIYDYTDMNIIGCCVMWFVEFLLNPIYWMFMFVVFVLFGIFLFFDFCFHVGRRNK